LDEVIEEIMKLMILSTDIVNRERLNRKKEATTAIAV
jgi:hypothetical protein